MNGDHTALTIQIAGQGRLEAHPPGDLDGARFEGRFVIWGMHGADGALFGPDVSLFDADAVAAHGRGVASAHLVGMRSGFALEGFSTSDEDYQAHTYGRASAQTRLRLFFDPRPDGTRTFTNRDSFTRGELVATYQADEFFQMDGRAELFDTRVNYSLLDSRPFSFKDVTVDLGEIAPRMLELSFGHNPEPGPAEPIPHTEDYFAQRGPGEFAERFAVGGTITTQR